LGSFDYSFGIAQDMAQDARKGVLAFWVEWA